MLLFALALTVATPPLNMDACGNQPVGWTVDGSYFVYKQTVALRAGPDTTEATYGMTVDAATGIVDKYLLTPDGTAPEHDKIIKRFELPAPRAEAFDAWMRSHPHQMPVAKAMCNGHILQVLGDNIISSWHDGGFDFAAGRAGRMQVWASAKAGKLSITSARWNFAPAAAKTGAMQGHIQGICSPDSLRVAWLGCRSGDEQGNRANPPEANIMLGPATGPSIELLNDETLNAASISRAASALAKAGFVSSRRSVAPESRSRSVVYAPEQLLEVAKKVAEAIPGGATVEVLTWKPECDLVVALGVSAKR